MDHSLAKSIMEKPLDELSKHILILRLELLDYNLQIVYTPGRKMVIAYALLRYPTSLFSDPSEYFYTPFNYVYCNYSKCFNTVNADYPNLECFYAAVANYSDY